jgi:hypothetical protein
MKHSHDTGSKLEFNDTVEMDLAGLPELQLGSRRQRHRRRDPNQFPRSLRSLVKGYRLLCNRPLHGPFQPLTHSGPLSLTLDFKARLGLLAFSSSAAVVATPSPAAVLLFVTFSHLH